MPAAASWWASCAATAPPSSPCPARRRRAWSCRSPARPPSCRCRKSSACCGRSTAPTMPRASRASWPMRRSEAARTPDANPPANKSDGAGPRTDPPQVARRKRAGSLLSRLHLGRGLLAVLLLIGDGHVRARLQRVDRHGLAEDEAAAVLEGQRTGRRVDGLNLAHRLFGQRGTGGAENRQNRENCECLPHRAYSSSSNHEYVHRRSGGASRGPRYLRVECRKCM